MVRPLTPGSSWLRGPATTEIDSPHLRGGGCLIAQFHRRTFVTSSHELGGNGPGNFLGKWESDRVSLGPHGVELSSLGGETRRRVFRPTRISQSGRLIRWHPLQSALFAGIEVHLCLWIQTNNERTSRARVNQSVALPLERTSV